jgi:hypothetical protein
LGTFAPEVDKVSVNKYVDRTSGLRTHEKVHYSQGDWARTRVFLSSMFDMFYGYVGC